MYNYNLFHVDNYQLKYCMAILQMLNIIQTSVAKIISAY